VEAEVVLEYDDAQVACAVAKAVSPDNFKTPKGLTVETEFHGKRVITRIMCDGKLATFVATIDDLLFSVSTAEKAVQAVKRLE
jgi:hypothetical protein